MYKRQESQDALWEGIKRGDISTVATDHCPFTKAEKDWGITQKDGTPGNFTTIPNGCAGIENMYPYMLSEANKGRISFNKAVELCATNPSKLFGLDHLKGCLLYTSVPWHKGHILQIHYPFPGTKTW